MGMALYEIDQQLINLFEMGMDSETGEILEGYELDTKIAELEMARDKKIEGVCLWYKNLQAEANSIKEEENNLSSRRKQKEKTIASLEKYVANALNGEEFETPKVLIKYRKSSVVEVDEEKFLKKHKKLCEKVVSYKFNKNELKKMIQNGETLSGVEIIDKRNMSIK